jgi:uncharacterized SAM-binding protein YcdF (DUF218 family)
MFFYLSKILEPLTSPFNLLLVALCLGTLLLWTPWRRGGRRLLALTSLVALAFAVLPVGDGMIRTLENRFPTLHSLPPRIDGVVILGGVVDQPLTVDRGQIALASGAERLIEAAAILRDHPEAKLVYSGGSGDLFNPDAREATVVTPFFASLGVEAGRILIEDRSRNTYENAVYSLALAAPSAGEAWVLVTSAVHMPRAVGAFRQAGWSIIPYPVDYGFTESEPFAWSFSLGKGLSRFGEGLHEWLGLVFYRLTDKSDAFFPGPA